VPGRIFASDALMEVAAMGEATQQVANVAHLPGIVEASFAMPDIHWGYGFPDRRRGSDRHRRRRGGLARRGRLRHLLRGPAPRLRPDRRRLPSAP